jgi:hypothetical protein
METQRNVTEERAARRYRQIAAIERQLAVKAEEHAAAAALVRSVKDDYEALLRTLRAAARDEGDLPLFADLDDAERG